jgi:catechol 2,3-dioxygenase-like lactoylglutathione lyase family enzyme
MSEPVVRMSSVVVNVVDLDRAKAFWTEVLGVGVSHEVVPFFAWLEPQEPGGVNLALQVSPDPKVGRNRVHVDTFVPDLDAAQRRIEDLGGAHVEDHEVAGFRWRIMADPDGNEFCIAADH